MDMSSCTKPDIKMVNPLEEYTGKDYKWEKETGRCRFCGNYILECTCDDDYIDWEIQ